MVLGHPNYAKELEPEGELVCRLRPRGAPIRFNLGSLTRLVQRKGSFDQLLVVISEPCSVVCVYGNPDNVSTG